MQTAIHIVYMVASVLFIIGIMAITQLKIDTVVAYVLHPDYQALEEGYGVMRAGKRRYYSMGWSVHLPGYDGFAFSRAIFASNAAQRSSPTQPSSRPSGVNRWSALSARSDSRNSARDVNMR